MSKKRILLTGDDGYNAPGLRLVIAALRDHYDLSIAATFSQQTGVGGTLSIHEGFDWGLSEVDGIPAVWVKGSPADAMELATCYYVGKPFETIVSGVNWGANLGPAIFSSGTMNAVLRGIGNGLVKRGIAMSWDLPTEYYVKNHNGKEKLEDLMKYPGAAIKQTLDLALENDFWGSQILNVNFPKETSSTLKFVEEVSNIREVFFYDDKESQKLAGQQGGHFSYDIFSGARTEPKKPSLKNDVGAIHAGYISISPFRNKLLDAALYDKLAGKEISLEE